MSIEARVQAKRRHILRTAARHGARSVRLFGSAARGEAGPELAYPRSGASSGGGVVEDRSL